MSPPSASEPKYTRSVPWKRYSCSEDPFRAGIDDRFIYFGNNQQERFDRLLCSIEANEGLSLVTGPAGVGKTSLLRKLVSDLRASESLTFFFSSPFLTLEAVLDGCRVQAGVTGGDNADGVEPIVAVRELLSGFDPKRSRVLLIDEAQSLPDEMLCDLLVLAEPGADGKSLLPIVLAGECSIVQRLTDEPFRKWTHSVGYRCELTPLEEPEVAALIRHRLSAAGCADTNPFSHDAIERMADYANGVAGTINTLCRLALFFASEGEETRVSAGSVELAASAALLNTEPLRASRMGLPKHSQSERSDDSEGAATGSGAAISRVSAAKALRRLLSKDTPSWLSFPPSLALRRQVCGLLSAFRGVLHTNANQAQLGICPSGNRLAPDSVNSPPNLVKELSAAERSLQRVLAILDAEPNQSRRHRLARVWSNVAISVLLLSGGVNLFVPGLWEGLSSATRPAVTPEHTKRTIDANESEESRAYVDPQPQVTVDVGANEADAMADATDPSNRNYPALLAAREQVQQALSAEKLYEANLQLQGGDELLRRARAAFDLGNLDEAVKTAQQGLEFAPEHSALAGLLRTKQSALAGLLRTMRERQSGVEQERREVDRFPEQGPLLVPTHPALTALESEVQLALAPNGPESSVAGEVGVSKILDKKAEISTLLAECEVHYRANRLTSGQGGTASDCYRKVLELEPANTPALEGITWIAEKYAGWATAKIDQRKPSLAHHYLDKLASVDPQYPQLRELRERLETLQRSNTRSHRAPKRRQPTKGKPRYEPKPKYVRTAPPPVVRKEANNKVEPSKSPPKTYKPNPLRRVVGTF